MYFFTIFPHNAWHVYCMARCLFKLSLVCYYKQVHMEVAAVSRLPFISFYSMALLLQFGVTLHIFSCNAHACNLALRERGTHVVRVKASASGLLLVSAFSELPSPPIGRHPPRPTASYRTKLTSYNFIQTDSSTCTELRKFLCTWFGEVCSCFSLPLLPELACNILATT